MPARKRTLLRPDERRRQLLEAATWVFARKGYRRAAVSDIIGRAGVARGTFYLYFQSKEQVFLAVVDDFHSRIRRGLEAATDAAAFAPAEDPRVLLQASFRQWLQFFADHRDATTVILKEASSIDSRFEKGFAEVRRSAAAFFAVRFHRLQELGLVRASISAELLAHLQLGMFDELLNAFVLPNENVDLDALAQNLAEFEWNGIRPEHRS
jgi:AcrR family transcriptional regulator